MGIIEGKGFEKKQGCLALEVSFRQHLFWKWERYSGYCLEDLGNSDWMISYDNFKQFWSGSCKSKRYTNH